MNKQFVVSCINYYASTFFHVLVSQEGQVYSRPLMSVHLEFTFQKTGFPPGTLTSMCTVPLSILKTRILDITAFLNQILGMMFLSESVKVHLTLPFKEIITTN